MKRTERILLAGPGPIPWIVIAALIGLGLAIVGTPNPTGDSGALIEGAVAIHGCLSDTSSWGSCGSVIPYAPLQFVPAIILIEFGSATGYVMAALSVLSAASFAAVAWLGWRLVRRFGVGLAAAFLAVVLSGPLVHYAASAFGEMLAAFAFVAVVYSVARRAPLPAVIGATWLAGISKDTAIPFVMILVGAVLLAGLKRPKWSDIKRPVFGTIAGSALAFATVSAFNLMRWGTISNEAYNWDAFQAPWSQIPKSGAGLLASPNGGLLVFWPAGGVVILACIGILIWGIRRPSGQRLWASLPAALVLAGATMQIGVLAVWWAPFGWSAWGPRLALPVFTGLVLAAMYCYGEQFRSALTWCGRAVWPMIILVGVLVFSTLANVGALVRPLIANFQTPAEICPPVGFTQESAPAYYRCLNWTMWNYEPRIIVGIEQLSISTGILVLGVVSAAAVAILIWMSTRPGTPTS